MLPTVARKVTLEATLDYMAEQFDGDLIGAATAAADYAVECGFVSGPLWDEIGVTVLKDLYKLRRIHKARAGAFSDKQTQENEPPPVTKAWANWTYAGTRWVQLGDMTNVDCRAVADYHGQLSVSNRVEREFYLLLAEGLAEGQTVGDRYTPSELAELRGAAAARARGL